jgi:HEPN domain-containing protein
MVENEFAMDWFRFAQRDLASARHLLSLHPQPHEIICYLCEQAVEKYLKGYLIVQGLEQPPRSHELDRLCELCMEYNGRFSDLKKACDVLTDYGVQPRYPHEMGIFEHHAAQALEYAAMVQAFPALAALFPTEDKPC